MVPEERVPEELKIVLLRVAQEAFNNALKHGEPETVELVLCETADALEMHIQDNGTGFDPDILREQERGAGGMGLESMRERIEQRQAHQDQIVERRFQTLVGEDDYLEW